MKKIILSITILLSILILVSCDSEENNFPEIVKPEIVEVVLNLGEEFSLPILEAIDKEDGKLQVLIDEKTLPDFKKAGKYEILYYVVDSDNNRTEFTFTIIVSEEVQEPDKEPDYELIPYYKGADGLSGDSLKVFLKDLLNFTMRGVNYGAARYDLAKTDKDILKDGNVILMYNRASVKAAWDGGTTWNREHVWPQSKLGSKASNGSVNKASDLHNLRPANPTINSNRGNSKFNDPKTPTDIHGVVDSNNYYPGKEDSGDVARILFYMNTMYGLNLNDVGYLDVLLRWHMEDPVDDFELRRNEEIYKIQKNRNPYIDNPYMAQLVYAN